MFRVIRYGAILATLQVLLGVLLFFIERASMEVSNFEIARSIVLASVVYFAFTLLELTVSNILHTKDSSYYIGANLGFSLLRMMLTIVLLFLFKDSEQFDFTVLFINLAGYYMLTLAFSAWVRTKLSAQKHSSHDTSH